MIEFIDTHCHIHEAITDGENDMVRNIWLKAGVTDPNLLIQNAAAAGVTRVVCVGNTAEDSESAVRFVQNRPDAWASIGIHPHEAKDSMNSSVKLQRITALAAKKNKKVVAMGECGLDYHYGHSSKDDQKKLLCFHLDLAVQHDLPLIFHIREAFDDFWPIFDAYKGLRGVVHSFSSTTEDLDQALMRGLYVGLNGIMTFTKDKRHLEAAKTVPLTKLLLETDAPFLTPTPYRGTICEPKHVRVTAEFLAELRGEDLGMLSVATSKNAKELFKLP